MNPNLAQPGANQGNKTQAAYPGPAAQYRLLTTADAVQDGDEFSVNPADDLNAPISLRGWAPFKTFGAALPKDEKVPVAVVLGLLGILAPYIPEGSIRLRRRVGVVSAAAPGDGFRLVGPEEMVVPTDDILRPGRTIWQPIAAAAASADRSVGGWNTEVDGPHPLFGVPLREALMFLPGCQFRRRVACESPAPSLYRVVGPDERIKESDEYGLSVQAKDGLNTEGIWRPVQACCVGQLRGVHLTDNVIVRRRVLPPSGTIQNGYVLLPINEPLEVTDEMACTELFEKVPDALGGQTGWTPINPDYAGKTMTEVWDNGLVARRKIVPVAL